MGSRNQFLEYFHFNEFVDNFGFFLDNHTSGFLYGKVTKKGFAVLPMDENTFAPLHPEDPRTYAINFVADAFRDMRAKYQRMGYTLFGQDLKPTRAYEDGRAMYGKHIDLYIKKFIKDDLMMDSDSKKIRTFKEFVARFKSYAMKPQPTVPLVLSSYVKSGFCMPHTTGLYFELERNSYRDLELKGEKIITNETEGFRELANKYGFVVPKHAPWCLMANIDSTIMHQYAAQHDLIDRTQMIPSYFIECRFRDIDFLRSVMEKNFYEFMENTATRKILTICRDRITSRFEEIVTEKSVKTIGYQSKDWIRLYFEIMSIEKKVKNPESVVDRVIDECYYINQQYGFEAMYEYGVSKLNINNRWKSKYR